MKLRRFLLLLTAIGIVLGLLVGLDEPRDGGGALAGGALVAGAVLIAGSRVCGGLLGEVGGVYWLVVLGAFAWSVTQFKRGGAAVAGGGLVSAALLVAFQRPKDEAESDDAER